MVDIHNIMNVHGALHITEIIVSIIVIICVSAGSSPHHSINEIQFEFVIAVGVLSILYAVVWLCMMLLNRWPPLERTGLLQLTRLILGMVVAQFYIAAFVICCVVAKLAYGPAQHLFSGFAAGAVFTAVNHLVHWADVFYAWWYQGGIIPPSYRGSE